MKLQLLPQLLLLSQLTASVLGRTRIIGGEEAELGKYDAAVSLKNLWTGHYCGGSLISADTVLTAAHCPEGDLAVIGRRNLKSRAGEEIRVASSIPHPAYNEATTNNDIRLVFLKDPIEDQDIEFMKLNSDSSTPDDGDDLTVVGWGVTDTSSSVLPNVLMAVDVGNVSNGKCSAKSGVVGGRYASYAGQISSSMLCASGVGKDSCQGDSGGPLIREEDDGTLTQVGIVSWGYGCALSQFPGVYARVSTFYDWIVEEVCENSSSPPEEFNCNGDNDTGGGTINEPIVQPTSPSSCKDTPGWVDNWGDSCDWYEKNDSPGCPAYGGSANGNCCYCGRNPTASIPLPVPSPTNRPTLRPVGSTPSQPATADDCWNGVAAFACCYFGWC